ncbi:MAG: ATP-binding protein [Steroidobacteraceae bacterium]
MARIKVSLAQYIGLGVIALHAVLLPLLYSGLDLTIRLSHEEIFTSHVRAYVRMVAEELELGTTPSASASMVAFLDSVALGGEVTTAEFIHGGRHIRSTLLPPTPDGAREDYAFGQGGDGVYYISTVIGRSGDDLILRMGFDERPTQEHIERARRGILIALAIYLAAAIVAALLLSYFLARPVRALREASRGIALGNVARQLHVRSGIEEMSELGADLETMRRELVGTNERLAHQMEQHAALEAQLRQKQRLETVGTLAGGVAHEFNNVLVPITLFTELALDSVPPENPAHASLQRVLEAARRARQVIAKVLDFSRHYSAETLQTADIAPAVEEGLRLFMALRPANIEVTARIEPNCSQVRAEPTLIVQVVMNLCTNAYQAMGRSGGTIHVSLANVALGAGNAPEGRAGDYLELCVRDTGQGMDAQTRERIFEPFFTTRDVGDGTGLGLSVVHGIATAMGATLDVQSGVGIGTTITMLIPTEAHARRGDPDRSPL